MGTRHSILFIVALIVGTGYYFADRIVGPGKLHTIWKGMAVGLLALWAARVARSPDGWLLAAVLALGATGDVLLETAGLTTGAVAFLAGHVAAIALYWRNRRSTPTASQRTAAVALVLGTPLIAWLWTRDAGVAVYAFGLGGMAGAAWLSRFPRYRTGVGAVLFVASDLLIFARSGPLAGSVLPGLLIWPTYFAGQALIARGVATMLEQRT